MSSNSNTDTRRICQYCHSNIKSKDDMLVCPECNSTYHIECWYENEGCGAYGCKYKIKITSKFNDDDLSVESILINIEFLINTNQYTDAINLCKRVLKIDGENVVAKKFFNRAVTLENSKQHLIESGESAFQKEDLIGAELFYTKALKYTNETETYLINTKLQIIKEKYPLLQSRKKRNRIISNIIGTFIVLLLSFLLYYNLYLKEQREFYSIENDDITTDLAKLELQISRYEKFVVKYKDGEFTDNAKEKISFMSAIVAGKVLKSDWRAGLKYLKKIDTNINYSAYKENENNIIFQASKEFDSFLKKILFSDKNGNYGDAKNYLEKCLAIYEQFSGKKFKYDKGTLEKALNLVNKKISLVLKRKEINKELSEKTKELSYISGKKSYKYFTKIIKVLSDESEGYFVCKDIEKGNLIAVRGTYGELIKGDVASLDFYKEGLVTLQFNGREVEMSSFSKVPGTLYEDYSDPLTFNTEKETILLRISYLKEQIKKIDSILKENLF